MKLIRKTKKYAIIKIPIEEYNLMLECKIIEEERYKYEKWFVDNHYKEHWQDEYSSWHVTWKENKTNKTVSQGTIPFGLEGSY